MVGIGIYASVSKNSYKLLTNPLDSESNVFEFKYHLFIKENTCGVDEAEAYPYIYWPNPVDTQVKRTVCLSKCP